MESQRLDIRKKILDIEQTQVTNPLERIKLIAETDRLITQAFYEPDLLEQRIRNGDLTEQEKRLTIKYLPGFLQSRNLKEEADAFTSQIEALAAPDMAEYGLEQEKLKTEQERIKAQYADVTAFWTAKQKQRAAQASEAELQRVQSELNPKNPKDIPRIDAFKQLANPADFLSSFASERSMSGLFGADGSIQIASDDVEDLKEAWRRNVSTAYNRPVTSLMYVSGIGVVDKGMLTKVPADIVDHLQKNTSTDEAFIAALAAQVPEAVLDQTVLESYYNEAAPDELILK